MLNNDNNNNKNNSKNTPLLQIEELHRYNSIE